jgi:hypothetical protein
VGCLAMPGVWLTPTPSPSPQGGGERLEDRHEPMTAWERFVETFFKPAMLAQYWPDIL